MIDHMAAIKAAADGVGVHARQEHLRIVTEDRDKFKRQAKRAWIFGAVGWALAAVAMVWR